MIDWVGLSLSHPPLALVVGLSLSHPRLVAIIFRRYDHFKEDVERYLEQGEDGLTCLVPPLEGPIQLGLPRLGLPPTPHLSPRLNLSLSLDLDLNLHPNLDANLIPNQTIWNQLKPSEPV